MFTYLFKIIKYTILTIYIFNQRNLCIHSNVKLLFLYYGLHLNIIFYNTLYIILCMQDIFQYLLVPMYNMHYNIYVYSTREIYYLKGMVIELSISLLLLVTFFITYFKKHSSEMRYSISQFTCPYPCTLNILYYY